MSLPSLTSLFGMGGEQSDTLIDMMTVDMVIGSGGVLSHAPRRHQTAMMLIDSFLPEGVTTLTVDSIFMMPQLGVLAAVHPEAATQVFERDCLIYLGDCIAPLGRAKEGATVLKASFASGEVVELKYGELKVVPWTKEAGPVKVMLEPASGLDMGGGRGKPVERTLHGGVVGLMFDGRGRRPFSFANAVRDLSPEARLAKLKLWNTALDLYPEEDG